MRWRTRTPIVFPLIVTLCAAALCMGQAPSETAIDRYVKRADPSYRWEVKRKQANPTGTLLVVDMVSQRWRSADEVNRPEWQHWLTLAIPAKPVSDTGLLFISGGKNDGQAPQGPSAEMQQIAAATQTIVAELKMVPNQPLIFNNDGVPRTEDDLIGYTWDQYLQTGEADWLARNAMIKSAVRAMDTMTAVSQEFANGHVLNKFVVAGASKRGWTTWLTGAIDKRVVAIVPIVIDVLNTDLSMRHHFDAYGYWAPAIGNYVKHHIMERLDEPRMSELLKLVDPYFYRHRLKIPKLVLNAAGDQFFLPDSWRFYWDALPGEKLLRYVPNADHSLRDTDALETLLAFYQMILQDKPRPQLSWELEGSQLTVSVTQQPDEVRLWTAANPLARDFRVETLGKEYSSSLIAQAADGKYRAKLSKPKVGWAAYFVECTFEADSKMPLKLTTGVYVVPDILPYADKPASQQASVTLKCCCETTERAEEILAQAKQVFSEKLGVDDLLTDQEETTLYLNWVPSDSGEEIGPVLSWFEKQRPSQLNIQLESGRGITKLPTSPQPQ